MADNINETAIGVVEEKGQAQNPELARMMAINLNGGLVPEEQKEVVTPVVEDTKGQNIQPEYVPFESLKEKFGYEKAEDAIRDIEDYRKLKEAPPKTDFEFANEDSKKLALAFQSGDKKAILNFLREQDDLDRLTTAEVTKDTASEIIKLGMQIKYKDLSASEIDYKFKKQFSAPKEPIIGADEDEDDFAVRKSEWQEKVNELEMEMIIEAKTARPTLAQAKSEIKLPEIQAQVDEDYEAYKEFKKSQEADPQRRANIEMEFNAFTPKSIETKIPYNDETNKIGFEFQYEPDVESFNKSREMALDPSKFLALFNKPDGTFDNVKFLGTLDFAINKEKMLIAAINQAKNATLKSLLPDNAGAGTQRYASQQQGASEFDIQMQRALGQYMPR